MDTVEHTVLLPEEQAEVLTEAEPLTVAQPVADTETTREPVVDPDTLALDAEGEPEAQELCVTVGEAEEQTLWLLPADALLEGVVVALGQGAEGVREACAEAEA